MAWCRYARYSGYGSAGVLRWGTTQRRPFCEQPLAHNDCHVVAAHLVFKRLCGDAK
jgi:hypothetical protein